MEKTEGRNTLIAAAVLGFFAVALGAFGAHGLERALEGAVDEAKRLAWWQTGVRYQMWHALLLVGLGALQRHTQKRARLPLIAVIVGVVLFSGSLYVMTLTNLRVLGAVTPLGGLAFLTAWVGLGVHARRVIRDG